MEEKETEEAQEKESIESFLKSKDKLLAAFGIFLALTLFTKDIETSTLGKYLSFIFMTLTMLVWLELWSSFPSKNRSWLLIAFENLINIGTMMLFLYWMVEYYEKGKLFVFLWIAGGIATLFTKLSEKLGWTNSIKEKKIWKYKFFRYSLGFVFMLFYLILTLGIAALIMGGLNPLVEILKE